MDTRNWCRFGTFLNIQFASEQMLNMKLKLLSHRTKGSHCALPLVPLLRMDAHASAGKKEFKNTALTFGPLAASTAECYSWCLRNLN